MICLGLEVITAGAEFQDWTLPQSLNGSNENKSQQRQKVNLEATLVDIMSIFNGK